MIISATEFARIRRSDDLAEQARASNESAVNSVWLDVVENYPELKIWVAHNKTVPLEILRLLAKDDDWQVRLAVAEKRKLDRALFELLSGDENETVRNKISLNQKCPLDIRTNLNQSFHG